VGRYGIAEKMKRLSIARKLVAGQALAFLRGFLEAGVFQDVASGTS
jgi:hypothetical protein